MLDMRIQVYNMYIFFFDILPKLQCDRGVCILPGGTLKLVVMDANLLSAVSGLPIR